MILSREETEQSYDCSERGALNALELYIRDMIRYPLLRLDEEKRLFRVFNQGAKYIQVLSTNGRFVKAIESMTPGSRNAWTQIINSNLRLVVGVAKKYQAEVGLMSLQDWIQEGNRALLKAVDYFDYQRDPYVKFVTYATGVVMKRLEQIRTHQRRQRRASVRAVSLDYLCGAELFADSRECAPDENPALHYEEASRFISELSDDERAVINLRVIGGGTLDELAGFLRVSRETIRNIQKSVIGKLRVRFGLSTR